MQKSGERKGQRAPSFGCRQHSWAPGMGGAQAPGLGRHRLRVATDLQEASVSPSVRQSPPLIPPTPTPKPSLGDPNDSEVQISTYRRISCLVRNVRSWKAKQAGPRSAGRPGGRAPSPPQSRPLRDPIPERRPRAPRAAPRAPGTRPAAPWTGGCPSPPSPPSRAQQQFRQLLSGHPATFSLPPSGRASPPRPRGNRP